MFLETTELQAECQLSSPACHLLISELQAQEARKQGWHGWGGMAPPLAALGKLPLVGFGFPTVRGWGQTVLCSPSRTWAFPLPVQNEEKGSRVSGEKPPAIARATAGCPNISNRLSARSTQKDPRV